MSFPKIPCFQVNRVIILLIYKQNKLYIQEERFCLSLLESEKCSGNDIDGVGTSRLIYSQRCSEIILSGLINIWRTSNKYECIFAFIKFAVLFECLSILTTNGTTKWGHSWMQNDKSLQHLCWCYLNSVLTARLAYITGSMIAAASGHIISQWQLDKTQYYNLSVNDFFWDMLLVKLSGKLSLIHWYDWRCVIKILLDYRDCASV